MGLLGRRLHHLEVLPPEVEDLRAQRLHKLVHAGQHRLLLGRQRVWNRRRLARFVGRSASDSRCRCRDRGPRGRDDPHVPGRLPNFPRQILERQPLLLIHRHLAEDRVHLRRQVRCQPDVDVEDVARAPLHRVREQSDALERRSIVAGQRRVVRPDRLRGGVVGFLVIGDRLLPHLLHAPKDEIRAFRRACFQLVDEAVQLRVHPRR
mmetsp:Transcript_46329/g.142913  ORF Transcript_46329/g.142913 Transcript_46329/m.142913 type:complete len:207 (+) Transcript_46329:1202-1822(+)